MAWLSDEQYLLMQDTKDKKITARSSRHTRTHCGKGGRVKFPSDYLSKKELKAMNGKCETYRMNSPISWDEFKSYPEEHQKTYIQLLRKKWNVPDTYIAEMFGVHPQTMGRWFKCLGLNKGIGKGAKVWDKEGFLAWRSGAKGEAVAASEVLIEESVVDPVEVPVAEESTDTVAKEAVEEPVIGETEAYCEFTSASCAVPHTGSMSFDGNIHDILRTIRNLLDGQDLHLTVTWNLSK